MHQPIKYCCCACIIGFSIHNIKFRVFFPLYIFNTSFIIFIPLFPSYSVANFHTAQKHFFLWSQHENTSFQFCVNSTQTNDHDVWLLWILRIWFFFHINLDIHPSSLDMVEMDASLCKLFFRFIYFGYDVNHVKKDRIKQCHIYLFFFYFLLKHFMFMYAYL